MNNKPAPTHLPEYVLQLLGAVAFFVMLCLDRITHTIDPPLDDVWYAIAVGIAVFGSGLKKVVDKFRG